MRLATRIGPLAWRYLPHGLGLTKLCLTSHTIGFFIGTTFMHAVLFALALASASPIATIDANIAPGTQLLFQGNFVAEKGAAAEAEKKFKLTLLISEV